MACQSLAEYINARHFVIWNSCCPNVYPIVYTLSGRSATGEPHWKRGNVLSREISTFKCLKTDLNAITEEQMTRSSVRRAAEVVVVYVGRRWCRIQEEWWYQYIEKRRRPVPLPTAPGQVMSQVPLLL